MSMPSSAGPPPYGPPPAAAGPVPTLGGPVPVSPDGPPPKAPSRTWRDLPPDPPFGPVMPLKDPVPRLLRRRGGDAQPPPSEDTGITPAQIALAVGGVLVLLALGIGLALWLLGDDDPEVADAPLPVETDQEGDPFGQFTPLPSNPPVDAVPDTPDPAPQDGAQGELTPQPTPEAGTAPDEGASPDGGEDGTEDGTGGDAGADDPSGEAGPGPGEGTLEPPQEQPQGDDPGTTDPEGDLDPPTQQGPAPQPPGTAPQQGPDPEDGEVRLDRLFELSQLPGGTSEEDTTVTQTSRGDEPTQVEQVTRLTHPDGPVDVTAVRAEDAADQLDALLDGAQAEEVSVPGAVDGTGYVLEGQRLVWLADSDPQTFLSIDGPATIGTDELLTIAQGLELNP